MNKLLFERVIRTSVWCLYGPIESFNEYEGLIKELYTSDDGDHILLLLNCPGGDIAIGQTLINAMKESKAFVECIVEAPCYSMGAILAICGNNLVLRDHSCLMFHTYSTMYYGKESDISAHHAADKKHFDQLMHCYCAPFLSEKERNNVLEGEELYIHWDDKSIPTRIKKHFKTSEKKVNEK